MRRRSLIGPVLLIVVGGLILLSNVRPDLPVFKLVALYWPFLLIAWGLVRLAEVIVWPSLRRPGGSLGGGEVALIVLICIVGTGLHSAHRRGVRFQVHGLEMLGQPYEFMVSDQKPVEQARRVVFDNLRGSVRVAGGDAAEVRVSGRKVVRALSREEADRVHGDTPLVIVREGDQIVVRTSQDRVPENQRVNADLECIVPRGVAVEIRGHSGDYEVSDLKGSVEISAGRADVRLSKIGGDVRVDLHRSDLVRAVDLAGALDLDGRGADLELENIAGQVTVQGSYGGRLNFKNLAKPLHFESNQTDLRVEAVPGQIVMDLGELSGRNLVGPIRLTTKSKDIRLEDFTASLELETERGDIELYPNRVPLAKIDARSRVGKIDLVLPPKAAFELQASVERGDAINNYGPPLEKEVDGHSAALKGKVGQGPSIHLVTDRGTVAVRKSGIDRLREAQL